MKIRSIRVIAEVDASMEIPTPGDGFELGDFRGTIEGVNSYNIYIGTEVTDRFSVDFDVKGVKVVD